MKLKTILFLILFCESLYAQPTLEYINGKVTNETEVLGIAFNLKIKMFLDQRLNQSASLMTNYMWRDFPLKPKDLFGSQNISNKFYPYDNDYEIDSSLRSPDFISWILVELRNADHPEISFQVPLILKSNGYLVSAYNNDFGTINIRPGRYYLVCTDVQSLGILSRYPVEIYSPNDYLSIDFTKDGSSMMWYGGVKKLQGRIYPAHPYISSTNYNDTTWAAWMGDCPSVVDNSSWDNLIDLNDWAEVQNHYSNSYLPLFDIYNDQDGVVNLQDETFVLSMFEKISSNPFHYR